MTPIRLSPTSLSQYVRLENCERYLRFRLVPEDDERLEKKWSLTIQPLTPLLQESGQDFEQDILERVLLPGDNAVDLDKKDVGATLQQLRDVHSPTVLIQPTLEAQIERFQFGGRADVIRLTRDRQGRLHVLIADIKASHHERSEHRLQVAVYARMFQEMARQHEIPVASIQGTILTMQEDAAGVTLGPDTPTFDLDTYLSILDRLAFTPDSVVSGILAKPFEEAFYHLSYKCDGCLFNALCMYDSAERLDLALTPHISAVEKRVLNEAAIQSLRQLAELMELPGEGLRGLTLVPAHAEVYDILRNRWPVAPNLPFLVQRARMAMRVFDKTVAGRMYLDGAGFGTLPADEDYPNLVKVFFDAQHDYIQDRVYLLSALVSSPGGQQMVVEVTDGPPTTQAEGELLKRWVKEVIAAVAALAGGGQAPIHLYCYNPYDQKVLLEALKRHLDELSALPAFFDLLTQSPALTQPVISFLSNDVQERLSTGRVCAPLHDIARGMGFDWKDDDYEYYRLFRARMFDNRRDVVILENGDLMHASSLPVGEATNVITIESASRFNSQIPLEYAYAAWGCLPELKENRRLLDPFRQVNLDMLRRFAGHRVRALAHIEGWFKYKARFLNKQPIKIPALDQAESAGDLRRSLQEFLHMEHHASLQALLQTYSLPVERRVQSGTALLLCFDRQPAPGVFSFQPQFAALGLDPTLTMNACKLKEGDWVVFNTETPDKPFSANQINHGRLATIEHL